MRKLSKSKRVPKENPITGCDFFNSSRLDNVSGLFLILMVVFNDYPLDKFALIGTVLNPIDLSRILILLKLDISALLGYTGAVFQQFFGSSLGMFLAIFILLLWVIFPVWRIVAVSKKKDF
jgi:Cu-processing system permease protein